MPDGGYKSSFGGCGDCVCRSCLLWWSQRCTHGGCWDEYRAKEEPWPGPVRTEWSAWNKHGEHEHWCRGGLFYPTDNCPDYIHYDRDKTIVRECLFANVVVYQDKYIQCSIINMLGCEECYRLFEERTEQ